ncbi:MAG TPA: M15 family metallopeptidase [Nannocystaceae bacterium]|nr:M15 family metallopeptidase [Nannocystaceae bacterium]
MRGLLAALLAVFGIAPDDTPVETTPVETVRRPEVDCTVVHESGYRKGKRRAIDVIAIDGRQIERRTADAFMAMQAAAAKDGIELAIYSAFRTHREQEYFYACYQSCACNSCAPAAKPGFSNHQSGHAIDIGMWPGVHDWLVANASRYGFVATVKSEPWHWEYRPKKKMRWPAVCAEV